jgi:two-component sensor histidine kinase
MMEMFAQRYGAVSHCGCIETKSRPGRWFKNATTLAAVALVITGCSQAEVGTQPEACFNLVEAPGTLADDVLETSAKTCTEQLPSLSDAHQIAFARAYAEAYPDTLSKDQTQQLSENTSTDAALIFEAFTTRGLSRENTAEGKARVAQMIEQAQSSGNLHAEAILRRTLGNFSFYSTDYPAAVPEFERAAEIAESAGMSGFVPIALLVQAAAAEKMGDWRSATETLRGVLADVKLLSDPSLRLACSNTTVIAMNVNYFPDDELNQRIEAARTSGDDAFANCLAFGIVQRALRKGDSETIDSTSEDLLARIEGTRLTEIKPKILFTLGQAAYLDGDYVSALDTYEESLRIFRDRGDIKLQFVATNSIANVLADIGDYKTAREMYEEAGRLFEETKLEAPVSKATIPANIAWTLAMQGDHQAAYDKYREAYEIMEAAPPEALDGFINYHLAKSMFELGQVDEAIEMAESAIPITLERRNPMEAAAIYSWIASRQIEQNDLANAETTLGLVEEIVSRDDVDRDSLTGDKSYRYWDADYHSNMATVLEKMGRPVQALAHSKRALELSYSRFETDQLEAAANAELKADLWERDQTIALSARDAELQELRLERSSAMSVIALALALLGGIAAFFAYKAYRMQRRVTELNEAIVAEEHHRTKNALQMASSLTRQFERDSNGQNKDLREIRQRLKTMALLHEHLRSANGAIEVEACAFLGELAAQVEVGMAPEGVQIEVECSGVRLTPGIATPLGLMLCEMMINACKHGFPHLQADGADDEWPVLDKGRGLIMVQLQAKGSMATARIVDNGVGDAVTDSTGPRTGSVLIGDLADQIGATVDFAQSAGGSCWTITGICAVEAERSKTEMTEAG